MDLFDAELPVDENNFWDFLKAFRKSNLSEISDILVPVVWNIRFLHLKELLTLVIFHQVVIHQNLRLGILLDPIELATSQ